MSRGMQLLAAGMFQGLLLSIGVSQAVADCACPLCSADPAFIVPDMRASQELLAMLRRVHAAREQLEDDGWGWLPEKLSVVQQAALESVGPVPDSR